jgi:NAD(P)-dependent dehydrogenase (short-subunit alcohol dehydrogenase family)
MLESRIGKNAVRGGGSEGIVKDKVCIVTGGSTGIGKATVEGLAKKGAAVVIACRDVDKGKAALDDIAAKTGSSELHVMHLDLASLKSVRTFATAFAAKFPRLDVLVENAGVMTGKRQWTADGLEMNFGVNHVGHFLLAELLLPLLKTSAPSRIVVVSSNLHASGKIDFADLAMDKNWSGSYPRSKLANMLFVRALAKRLDGTKVVVNGLHPGVVSTELARDYAAPIRLMAKWFFKSPMQGARTSLYLATAPEAAGISGRYFADAREKKPGAAALDDALAERLWTETDRLIANAALPALAAERAL